ncbi:alpha/beta hydrolase [Cyclobacterium qasimii]|uniref:Endo-1,4-beta-xylanase B n=2 Tax=Cyclobacterium qasimii TaxID=1350429 RepID=S7VBX7_9BACT|nr:alpha/beta hydrolase [Cyclobacterium qasimii]EPR67082.1 endo-1,4-beta-xylanase B [Cyclobacterium qasimii M12-11B]GEO19707.1 endo-1,4-beta-xylanase [Cyclobacterium qasimii]
MKPIALILFLIVSIHLEAQQVVDLYPNAIPNSKPNSMIEEVIEKNGQVSWLKNVSKPTLTIYHPDKEMATGAGVIICPGGGYSGESYLREGTQIAEAFVRKGIAAFILKYRLPSDSIMIDKSIGPLQDAQQAIKTVRQHASEWGLDAQKIGIIGFSAGGHLAATAGTHFNKSYIPNDEKISLKPDFMMLIYPVISMKDELAHLGSRQNLLGKDPSEEQILLFSNELQIDQNTPPTWLTHAGDDNVVTVENSIRFYQGLIRNNVPAEMHLYPKGNHGFVLSSPAEEWMQPLFGWMNKSGIVKW